MNLALGFLYAAVCIVKEGIDLPTSDQEAENIVNVGQFRRWSLRRQSVEESLWDHSLNWSGILLGKQGLLFLLSNKGIVQLVGHFRETSSQKIELVLFKMAAEQIDDQVSIDRPCFLEFGFAFARDLYNQPARVFRAIQLRYQALCCHSIQTTGQGATRKHNFAIDVAKSHFAVGSMAQVEQDVVESERHQPLRFKLPLDQSDYSGVADEQLAPSGHLFLSQ